MRLYPSITVDLYKPYPLVILEVPQYNIGRGALVTLTAGGSVVIPTNEIIETYALKPDGTKVYNTAILAGNQVQINFSEQMTGVDGILQCELQMIDALGHSITTPIFAVRILKSNIDANAITSQDDFQALVDALAEVEEIKSTIQKGDPGEAATVQVGTVTASEPGGDPEVTNSGTENAAVLNFTLPRGEPGSIWYQGDAITGTSTSGTVFSGSGIENAEINDMYLNTGSGADKGNIYVCVLAGPASTAQWAYKQNIMGPTGPAGTANASSVTYDNESSGLEATNVQGALDELNQKMSFKPNMIGMTDISLYVNNTWHGNVTAGQTVDLGVANIPEGKELIAIFLNPRANLHISMSYYAGHVYAYSETFTGELTYDVLMVLGNNSD